MKASLALKLDRISVKILMSILIETFDNTKISKGRREEVALILINYEIVTDCQKVLVL